jgi:hypothetical protein
MTAHKLNAHALCCASAGSQLHLTTSVSCLHFTAAGLVVNLPASPIEMMGLPASPLQK